MEILSVTSAVGFIGLLLLLIGLMNKTKSLSKQLVSIGVILMAIHIVVDAGLGFYDGYLGNPPR